MKNKLSIFKDEERGGTLIPFEILNLPFQPKRIFTVTDIPKGSIRGRHAHYETQQIIICIKGIIIVYLDDGTDVSEYVLEEGESVFVDRMVWDTQKYVTGEDVMLVLSSTHYNTEDYILDKDVFYKLAKQNNESNNITL